MRVSSMLREFRSGKEGIISSTKLAELVRSPVWYKRFPRDSRVRNAGIVFYGLRQGISPRRSLKRARRHLYADMMGLLATDRVILGTPEDNLYDFDSERMTIDRFVIHHTARKKGISLPELSAVGLIRLYVDAFRSPSKADEKRLHNKPIYSGHYRKGRQVFFPYHWLIKQDGTSIRLLADDEIGWHANSWTTNCRSIAICFDDDLSNKSPNLAMLNEARRIMREYYGALIVPSPSTVLGAQEVTNGTIAPGTQFLSGDAWKNALIVKGRD